MKSWQHDVKITRQSKLEQVEDLSPFTKYNSTRLQKKRGTSEAVVLIIFLEENLCRLPWVFLQVLVPDGKTMWFFLLPFT